MKLTRSKLKEIIKEELIKEFKVASQKTIGNAYVTKYTNGWVTIHVGGRSNSTIQFSKREASELHKVLMKMT
mgnify:CR=1 FL=1|jgi:hypothetical protein|tara:strand:- start:4877 stop:5092 length:216 start_codon:yes stop_codon:yes gene_type:complete